MYGGRLIHSEWSALAGLALDVHLTAHDCDINVYLQLSPYGGQLFAWVLFTSEETGRDVSDAKRCVVHTRAQGLTNEIRGIKSADDVEVRCIII